MEHLENEFKKRFSDQHLSSEGFDADGLWDDISGELDHKPVVTPPTNSQPVRRIATVIIGAILISLVAYIIMTSNNNDNNQAHAETIINTDKIADTHSIKNQNQEYTDRSLATQDENNKSTDINRSSSDIQIIKAQTTLLGATNNDNENNQIGSLAYANDQPIDLNKQTLNQQSSDQKNRVKQPNSISESTKQAGDQSKSLAYANNIKSVLSNQSLAADQNQSSGPLANTIDNTEKTKGKSSSERKVETSTTKAPLNNLNIAESTPLVTTIRLDKLPRPLSTLVYDSKEIKPQLINAPTYDIDYHNDPLSIYTNIYGGVNSFTQTYSSTQASDLVGQLNNVHNTYLGTNLGIGATARLHNTWSINTGIEYNKLWNKLDITQQNTISRLKEDQLLKVWIQQSTGDTISEQRGTANINVIQTRDVVHYNSYQRITIPLELGINKVYKRWSYGINAGVAFNFTTSQSGKTLDNTGAIVAFDMDSEVAVFRSFDLGLRANVNIKYHITDHISLYLSPQWMRVKGYNRGSNITSSIQQLQLNTGIQYRLK